MNEQRNALKRTVKLGQQASLHRNVSPIVHISNVKRHHPSLRNPLVTPDTCFSVQLNFWTTHRRYNLKRCDTSPSPNMEYFTLCHLRCYLPISECPRRNASTGQMHRHNRVQHCRTCGKMNILNSIILVCTAWKQQLDERNVGWSRAMVTARCTLFFR